MTESRRSCIRVMNWIWSMARRSESGSEKIFGYLLRLIAAAVCLASPETTICIRCKITTRRDT
jgi:hypothetical protein